MTKTKHFLTAILLGVLFTGSVLLSSQAAQGPAVVGKPWLISFNATPLYGDDGMLESLNVVFSYKVPMLLPDGKSVRSHIKTEKADFIVQKGQIMVIGDQLVEFGDLAEDIMAVAEFVWNLNNPPRLPISNDPIERRKKVPPTKRKALREQ